MRSKPVENYTELQRRIQELRRQNRGSGVVFRGQVKFYGGRVRPSIARPGSQDYLQALHPLWYTIASDLLFESAIEYHKWLSGRAKRSKSKVGKRASQGQTNHGKPKGTLGSHVEAILQHYGARSQFVDVTKSLRVALWFAHHRHRFEEMPLLPDDVPDPGLPLAQYGPMPVYDVAWYDPAWPKQKAGYLFVLSPNVSDDTKGLRHGDFVDLTPNYHAARVGCQQAGLVYADIHVNAGDLEQFVREVFRFTLPLAGAPPYATRARTLALFPSPIKDRMYRDLLSRLPFRDTAETPFAFQRILRIPEYYQSYEEAAGSVHWRIFRKCDRLLPSTRFFPGLSSGTDELLVCRKEGIEVHLRDATPIFCPQSIHFMMEPTSTKEFNFADGGAGYFFEYDPLRLGVIPQGPVQSGEARGIWIVRQGNRFWCRVFWKNAQSELTQFSATLGHFFTLEEGKHLELDGRLPSPQSVEAAHVSQEQDFLVLALSLLIDVFYQRRGLKAGPVKPYLVLTEQILAYP